MAKTFGAPLFNEATAADDANDLVNFFGDSKVAYCKVLAVKDNNGTAVKCAGD